MQPSARLSISDLGVHITGISARRLRAIAEIVSHDELDDPAWLGLVQFSFGSGQQVKGAVQPALRDLGQVDLFAAVAA